MEMKLEPYYANEKKSWDFLLQIVNLNLEVRDLRIEKFKTILQQKRKKEEAFDQEYLKMIMAILMEFNQDKKIINEVAEFHEKEIQKEQLSLFVSILMSEVEANKNSIIKEFDLMCLNHFSQSDKSIGNNFELSILKRKNKKLTEQVFVLHPKEQIPKPKIKRTKKSLLSSKDKVISVLENHQSFLIYQEAFPLPNGIKRIRIKENFDKVLEFIKDYISDMNLPADIIFEGNIVKILFKDDKKKANNSKDKKQPRIKAA